MPPIEARICQASSCAGVRPSPSRASTGAARATCSSCWSRSIPHNMRPAPFPPAPRRTRRRRPPRRPSMCPKRILRDQADRGPLRSASEGTLHPGRCARRNLRATVASGRGALFAARRLTRPGDFANPQRGWNAPSTGLNGRTLPPAAGLPTGRPKATCRLAGPDAGLHVPAGLARPQPERTSIALAAARRSTPATSGRVRSTTPAGLDARRAASRRCHGRPRPRHPPPDAPAAGSREPPSGSG